MLYFQPISYCPTCGMPHNTNNRVLQYHLPSCPMYEDFQASVHKWFDEQFEILQKNILFKKKSENNNQQF